MTHWETSKNGFHQKYESLTFTHRGDIYHYSVSKTGDVEKTTYEAIRNPANVVQKGKEIWVVDEAGMVGSRQMHELFKKAEQANAKVVLVGDIKQLHGVEAGRMFGKLQESGVMETVQMTESMRQKEEGDKEAAKDMAEKRIDSAMDRLERQDRVHEITGQQERLKAITQDYLKGGRDTIIVTSRNEDRKELNAAIRNELKDRGISSRMRGSSR